MRAYAKDIERKPAEYVLQYFVFVDELKNALECHVDVVSAEIGDKQFPY